jgi:hypothetical protein
MKNTTRIGPNNPGATRTYKPGDNPSRADTSHAETPSLQGESDAKRREYAAQERKAQAEMSAERARQASATD